MLDASPTLSAPPSPGSLTHEQLQSLAAVARTTFDGELQRMAYAAMGARIGSRRCPVAMAFCVRRQALIDAEIALARAVTHARAAGALCTAGPDRCCTVCGVALSPCERCRGIGYHTATCPESEAPPVPGVARRARAVAEVAL